MIGKIIKGSGFQGCLCYVMGKTGAVVIDTNMDGNNPYSLATEFSLSWQPVSYTHLTLPTNREV